MSGTAPLSVTWEHPLTDRMTEAQEFSYCCPAAEAEDLRSQREKELSQGLGES